MKTATTQMHLSKLQALALEHPEWPQAFTAAKAAVDADFATAESGIHPFEIPPTPADAVAIYRDRIMQFPVGRFREDLERFHLQTVKTFPAAAALARSMDASLDVGRAAAVNALPAVPTETFAEAGDRAAQGARRAFTIAIARQIAAVDGHELRDTARALLQADEHRTKLDALKAKHDEHVAAEQARLEAECAESARKKSAERGAAELAAELATELGRLGAAPSASEVARIRAMVPLRRRLRQTPLTRLKVGYQVFDPHTLGATGFSLEQCQIFKAALDAAENASSGAGDATRNPSW